MTQKYKRLSGGNIMAGVDTIFNNTKTAITRLAMETAESDDNLYTALQKFDEGWKVLEGERVDLQLFQDDDQVFHVILYNITTVEGEQATDIESAFPVFRGDIDLFRSWLQY